MGVVFFPSLPFMGVMLFPSFVLGNAFGEGGAPLASFSPFYVFFFLFSFFFFFIFFSTSPSSSSLPSAETLFIPFFFFSYFPSFFPHLILPLLLFPFLLLPFLPPYSAISFFLPEVFFFFLGNYLYQLYRKCKG